MENRKSFWCVAIQRVLLVEHNYYECIFINVKYIYHSINILKNYE